MVRTIVTASCISVQGEFVKELSDGRVVVRIGDRTFAGYPVGAAPKTPKLCVVAAN